MKVNVQHCTANVSVVCWGSIVAYGSEPFEVGSTMFSCPYGVAIRVQSARWLDPVVIHRVGQLMTDEFLDTVMNEITTAGMTLDDVQEVEGGVNVNLDLDELQI